MLECKPNRDKISVGNYMLSLQGSRTHYSIPREYLENIQDYKSVEVAIFKENSSWVDPKDEDVFSDFKDIELLLGHFEDGANPVGGQVPIGLVNDFIEFLNDTAKQ